MLNLQSKVAGPNRDLLLPKENSEALNEGTEKRGSGKTFVSLMTEFLGLNVDEGSKENQGTKVKSTFFDSFDELGAEKQRDELQLDLTNLKEIGKEVSVDTKNELQTIDLPDELLIKLSHLIQMIGGKDQLIASENLEKTGTVQLGQGGENNLEKPGTNQANLKALNELLNGLQIKRSGEKIVLTTPDSNTELTAEKKKNIQNQLLKIVRQLSGQAEQSSLKQSVTGITTKPEAEVSLSTDSKQVAKAIKDASSSTQLLSKNRLGFMGTGGSHHGEVKEGINNENQTADTQQTQKLALKDLIRMASDNVESKSEKTTEAQNGSQQLSSESKESGLFSNSKERSGLLTKQLGSQSDQKLEQSVNISKNLADENSRKKGELTSQKTEFQKTKNSSPTKIVDKSQSKPIQVSSTFEMKNDEATFKPLVKIETQNGNVDLDFQSQGDAESGDSEEGKSFLKLNNTGFNQLTKSSGRREFSTQMAKQLQKQADQSGLGTAKNWSQHRFVLENGDSVNVAVKHSEGVMQLQLGAGNSELNKILIQNINEIREHLQEQMNVDIDLQLQQFGDQQADLNDNSRNRGKRKQDSNNSTNTLKQDAEPVVGSSKTSARYLGFNQNEWTA